MESWVCNNVIIGYPKLENLSLNPRFKTIPMTPPGRVKIGNDGILRGPGIIYEGVIIGDRLRTGHNWLIREDTRIGDDCLVGTNVVIENGCIIGNRCSFQTGVYIPTDTKIEDGVFLGPNVTISNSKYMSGEPFLPPTIHKDVRIGANATILPGVEIGEGALIGAGAVVVKDVLPNSVVVGNPSDRRL